MNPLIATFAVASGAFLLTLGVARAGDCQYVTADMNRRVAANEFATLTAREVAYVDAVLKCDPTPDPRIIKYLEMRMDFAPKVDAGQMTKDEARVKLQLYLAQITAEQKEAEANKEAAASEAQRAAFANGLKVMADGLRQKTTTCSPNGTGGVTCTGN